MPKKEHHMSAQERAEQGISAVRRSAGLRAALLLAALASQSALAGPFGDEMPGQRVAQAAPDELEQHVHSNAPAALPPGTCVMRDVPYGSDRRQRFDVYVPRQANGAQMIFMVHVGAWRFGSKAERAVIENKMPRWVSAGFAFVSTDYRMLPTIDPLEQAKDVARAV